MLIRLKILICFKTKSRVLFYLNMILSDQQFREQFKPLHIPPHYDSNDTEQNKIVFALAQINEGTVATVTEELLKLDSTIDKNYFTNATAKTLSSLFEKGLIKGDEIDGEMHYNLSKITHANDGSVDPNLLAPGLD